MSDQRFLAKALYDNIAESPDEIAFRRGDVLTVVELDTGGLDGWWLCMLRGKQGIAPGNRLKILSGMSDGSREEDLTSSSGSLEKRSTRSSLDAATLAQMQSSPHMRGTGTYDEPGRSFPDYDVPPSRHLPKAASLDTSLNTSGTSNSLTHSNNSLHKLADTSLYDQPQPSLIQTMDNLYDVPQLQSRNSLEVLDTCPSDRSSVLSTASNDSSLTVSSSASSVGSRRLSNPSHTSDSARSSFDASSFEIYDTPSKGPRNIKQLSADSGLDIYDTPPKAKPTSPHSPASLLEDYDTPPKAKPTSPPSFIEDYDTPPKAKPTSPASLLEDYDVPKEQKPLLPGTPEVPSKSAPGTDRTKQLEHALDDVYDVPKNNAPKVEMKRIGGKITFSSACDTSTGSSDQMSVYDIPPQVTRDSVISSRSDSSEEGQRLSTCSLDSRGSISDIPTYDELLLDMDAALELLTKLQQDVQKSTNKFLGFVSSSWRKKESLQTKLYDIKVASNCVKKSLFEFIEFAQGTLANSTKLQDRKLVNKLFKQLNPLQNSLQLITSALKNLDEKKWQTEMLAEPLDSSKSDDLGQIATLCKDLTGQVRKIASFIQGNSTLLFPRAHGQDGLDGRISEKRASIEEPAAAKPPISPKPDTVIKQRAKHVQQRPLPPPPSTDRPLPPTPVEDQMKSLRQQYQEKDEESGMGDIYANDTSEWIQENDYVHLESCDIAAQLKIKKEKDSKLEREGSPPSESDVEPTKDDSEKVEDPYETKLEADLEAALENTSKVADVEAEDSSSFDIDNLLEQELKTPVNVNNVTDVQFVLPEVDLCKVDSAQLDPNDRQVLVFYAGQLETHSTLLANAVDAFFSCVESNEPPNVFISHSKFVIVSAHKLVYIGDTLHRNIMHTNVKNRIMQCANQLCDCLKLSVSATKVAALQYPSVPAVQDMVDRVMEVSRAAHNLKLVISQASAL